MTSRHVSEAGFVLLCLLGLLLEWRARRAIRRGVAFDARAATLGETLSSTMRTTPGRVAVLGVWWWLGWHFLAR